MLVPWDGTALCPLTGAISAARRNEWVTELAIGTPVIKTGADTTPVDAQFAGSSPTQSATGCPGPTLSTLAGSHSCGNGGPKGESG